MNHHAQSTVSLGIFSKPLIGGRPLKFTPERIEQIKNLVERGKSRDEIAELIGVTVGSLAVTCSRLGISLRRPKLNNGIRLLRQTRPFLTNTTIKPSPVKSHEVDSAKFALRMQYMGLERTTDFRLTQDMIEQLALEAEFRDMRIGEFVGELIIATVKKGLLRQVLGSEVGSDLPAAV
jgi:hypothetical protein